MNVLRLSLNVATMALVAVANMDGVKQDDFTKKEETYPLCQGWKTNQASDDCANPTGNGITINGTRYLHCDLTDDVLCFTVSVNGPLTYTVHAR